MEVSAEMGAKNIEKVFGRRKAQGLRETRGSFEEKINRQKYFIVGNFSSSVCVNYAATLGFRWPSALWAFPEVTGVGDGPGGCLCSQCTPSRRARPSITRIRFITRMFLQEWEPGGPKVYSVLIFN